MSTTPADPHRILDSKEEWVPTTSRLRALKPADLNPTQRTFYDSMVANEVPWAESGGAHAIAADGSLLGPFNPLLFSPAISAAMLGVFRADNANTSLPARVHEIVILTVGAACQAAYELYAHRAIGTAVGLPDTTINAIIAGEQPDFESEAEAAAYDFTWQLTLAHRVDDTAYWRAAGAFGEAGLVDMVMLIGLYLTVCAVVNAFEVPVPIPPQPGGGALAEKGAARLASSPAEPTPRLRGPEGGER
jgi:4-carboxymuconolactone decarboxylase